MNKEKLTIQNLKEMASDTVFLKGEIVDSPAGINMMNSGKQLRWVACRGGIHDWCIYCDLAEKEWEDVKREGNKVTGEYNIRKLVVCDDEAFVMYRY